MLLYRVCDENELNIILENKLFKDIGGNHYNDPKASTHLYDNSKKYMHFFPRYDSIFYMTTYHFPPMFICTYDIPDEMAKPFEGFGFYSMRVGGQEYYEKRKENSELPLKCVNEYAIPSDLVLWDYLVRIQKIKKDLPYYEYLENNNDKRIRTMYDNAALRLMVSKKN